MKLTITTAQMLALNDLRGLPDGAHMLIMCAMPSDEGAVLDGSKQAFQELVEHINEDLCEGLISGRAATVLGALCVKIDPKCAGWLGM